ncbi:MAG: FMN-binding glutamate synthase family protein [Negativicutes bacterium]|nr:FMN-binding glutamate synthase family protein [Negativicutes bacterium]
MQFTVTNPVWLIAPILLLAALVLAGVLLAKPLFRYVVKIIADDLLTKILTDKYTQNLAEMLPSLKRFSVLNLIELSLRAEEGKAITRPLGSPKHFLGFENLMFSPRQMTTLSLPDSTPVDMSVTIGATAKKPLPINIPLMISAMAYGLALSEEAKTALAKAANSLQTATCSGEGPVLPEEQQTANKYVLQISRWSWGGRTDEQIAAADMLEVQMGQGADMGTSLVEATELAGRARILGGLAPDQPAVALPAPPGLQRIEDWPDFMNKLRQKAADKPIALKIMATDRIEEDLAAAIDLGFDGVVIDGAQGGSHATSPLKQDDFGIPTLHALVRAKRFLGNRTMSLIIAGGFFTPGQCLKALALGADAIYLATVPLFALAHNQTHKVTPWEPVTTLIYYDSPAKTQLNVEQAATSVANALTSMILEMQEAMRALGKTSLKELCPEDLVSLDSATAEVTGVKWVLDGSPLSIGKFVAQNTPYLTTKLDSTAKVPPQSKFKRLIARKAVPKLKLT